MLALQNTLYAKVEVTKYEHLLRIGLLVCTTESTIVSIEKEHKNNTRIEQTSIILFRSITIM